MRLSKLAGATLLLALLVGGVAVGRVATPDHPAGSASPSARPAAVTRPPDVARPEASETFATPAPVAVAVELPPADVPGEELDRLPRYPGSVRTAFERLETAQQTTASAGYLARASLDRVRIFYRSVFTDLGWTVADMTYTGEGWRFIVVGESATEASVALGESDGVVDIRLQLITPKPPPPPQPEAPATAPPPAVAPPPLPPPPPPPADDDEYAGDTDAGDPED